MASAGTKRRAAEAAAGAASGGSSAVGGKRKRGAGPPPPSDGRDDDGWDVDAEAAAAMRAGVEVAAVAAAFGQRDVGSNLLDHYVRRLEGSRGDALAAYETVWVCDQLCEDVAARCAALPPSRRDAAAALLVDLSDAKVAVLDTAYEAVDILISQLDRRARLLEAVVREQSRLVDVALRTFCAVTHPHVAVGSGAAARKPRAAAVAAAAAVAGGAGPGSATAPAGVVAMRELAAVALSGATSRAAAQAAGAAPGGDSNVDPMEPTYCICHQVAFGDMIACDNPDCAVEWFHCQCVGITRATHPSTWYCKDCTAARAAAAAAAAAPPLPKAKAGSPSPRHPARKR